MSWIFSHPNMDMLVIFDMILNGVDNYLFYLKFSHIVHTRDYGWNALFECDELNSIAN